MDLRQILRKNGLEKKKNRIEKEKKKTGLRSRRKKQN